MDQLDSSWKIVLQEVIVFSGARFETDKIEALFLDVVGRDVYVNFMSHVREVFFDAGLDFRDFTVKIVP